MSSLSTSTGMILHSGAAIQTSANRVCSDYPFHVAKLPLYGPDGIPTDLCGLFVVRDGIICEQIADSSVSQKYVPHTNEDVAALAEAALAVFGPDSEIRSHWNKGHFLTVKPSRKERLEICRNDSIFPTFGISAGYNGKSFSASLLFCRDLCTNLARIQTVMGTQVSIRHTKNLRKRMPELVDNFAHLSQKWDEVTQVVARLNEKTIVLNSFLDYVFPIGEDSKAGATRSNNRKADVVRRIRSEAYATGKNTDLTDNQGNLRHDATVNAWQGFNGVQGYLQHETLASKRQRGDALGEVLQTMTGVTATTLMNAEKWLLA